MNLKTLSTTLVVGISVLVFVSCRKQNRVLDKAPIKNVKQALTVISPTIEDGMLAFTDQTHYDDWVEYLDAEIYKDTLINPDTISQDSILHLIEINLGFNSLRQKAYEDFEVLNEIGWVTIDEIPDRHWIQDIVLQSTLNEYEEVKIGSEIISHASPEVSFVITDATVLPTVRDYKTSVYESVYGIYQEPDILQTNIDVNGISQIGNFDIRHVYYNGTIGGTRTVSKGTSEPYRFIAGTVTENECISNKVTFDGYYLLDPSNQSKVQANYSIDWGDGNGYQSIGNISSITLTNTYSTSGTKTVNIKAQIPGKPDYILSEQITVEQKCNIAQKGIQVWYYPATGWALKARTWNYQNVRTRVKSYSESYKWKNGRWRHRKCDNLYVMLDAIDNNKQCNNLGTQSKKTSSHRSKRLQVKVKLSDRYWSNNSSSHAIFISGNWYQYNQVYTPCP